jgi:phenylalanyl-tRNA synthetase alpha chain
MSINWEEHLTILQQEIDHFSIANLEDVERYRVAFLGTKGKLKDIMSLMSKIEPTEKKNFGLKVNELKQFAEKKWMDSSSLFESKSEFKNLDFDMTAPAGSYSIGSKHPIRIVRNQIIDTFKRIGFTVYEGPEIEDDWHNFTALNTPADHPARDMQDTFFVTEDKQNLLRTHTSSAQIRALQQGTLPLRIITPGRVYRNETISARAHSTFHQIEGLYVDENVSFADLKQCIYYFAKELFESENVRFRPSFFPFTEPSAEMDISCFICKQKGCRICKGSGWVEIGGCGMVDPNVLKNNQIDTEKYNGFAFGMGIERICMLLYQVNDIRHFWNNDIRFLSQFKHNV